MIKEDELAIKQKKRDKEPPLVKTGLMLKRLGSCVGEYKKYAILAPLCVVFEVIIEVLIPLLMAQIINIGMDQAREVFPLTLSLGKLNVEMFTMYNRMGYICAVGGLMVGMALISLMFGALSGRFAAVAATGFGKNLRRKLYYKIQDFSFNNIDKFSTSSLITRLTTDVTNTQLAFMLVVRILVRAPVMFVLAMLMAISIEVELSVSFLVVIPVLVVVLGIMAGIAFPRFSLMLKRYDKMNEVTQENLIGIRLVKAYVRTDHETEQFKRISESVRVTQLRAEKVMVMAGPVMQLAMYACLVACVYFGGIRIIGGTMLIGSLSAFISYVTQILISLMMIGMVFVMLVLSRASASRIVEVIEEKVDIVDSENVVDAPVADGSIEFKDVDFSYSGKADKLNLENVSLKINSGEVVGIVGGTGSAKTTLVQLIPRLYDVYNGKVEVGGKDVRDYSLNTLRNSVAMVLQKNVLFSGTIMENLKWGNENATEEEVVTACKAAQAHDFIMGFPKGYETDLGQGGVNVSGGQKQRLCIARALLKSPKVMILDDSTSAVDTATDAKIRDGLKQSFGDITVLIIAQRVASVCDCDRIIVLDDGKINAVGTHDELLKSNEIYRSVYESQQKGVAE